MATLISAMPKARSSFKPVTVAGVEQLPGGACARGSEAAQCGDEAADKGSGGERGCR